MSAEYIGETAKKMRLAKGINQAQAATEAGVAYHTWRIMESGYVPKRGSFIAKVQKWMRDNKKYRK